MPKNCAKFKHISFAEVPKISSCLIQSKSSSSVRTKCSLDKKTAQFEIDFFVSVSPEDSGKAQTGMAILIIILVTSKAGLNVLLLFFNLLTPPYYPMVWGLGTQLHTVGAFANNEV